MDILYYVLLSVVIIGIVLRTFKEKKKRTAPGKKKLLNIKKSKYHTKKFSGEIQKIKCKEIINK